MASISHLNSHLRSVGTAMDDVQLAWIFEPDLPCAVCGRRPTAWLEFDTLSSEERLEATALCRRHGMGEAIQVLIVAPIMVVVALAGAWFLKLRPGTVGRWIANARMNLELARSLPPPTETAEGQQVLEAGAARTRAQLEGERRDRVEEFRRQEPVVPVSFESAIGGLLIAMAIVGIVVLGYRLLS